MVPRCARGSMRALMICASFMMCAAAAFAPPTTTRSVSSCMSALPMRSRTLRFQQQNENDATNEKQTEFMNTSVNGVTLGISGGLTMGSALQNQLVSAFTALDEADQYDAVLTGLCAKILDATDIDVAASLQDAIQLLEEMNARRIRASERSLMALIDATVTAQDAKLMSKVVSLSKKNGGISQYGNFQASITPLPTARTSKVRCPDGITRTRADRIEALPDVPVDDRGTEITSALAVGSVIAFCGTVDVLGLDEISGFTNFVWFMIVFIGVVDNFFDMIKGSIKIFAKEQSDKVPDTLPLSLGSGQITGTVVKGFNRLLQVDTERECECEAAAFFAAYALGLPCFAFRPNALEAAVLVAESESEGDKGLDPLLSNNGIMKMLVWLMAPVAMENMKHPQLVVSDPREGSGLLTRLESSGRIQPESLWWTFEGEEERNDMIKWAYIEADLLLRSNQKLVSEISKRLIGGSATVGDCVAAMENW